MPLPMALAALLAGKGNLEEERLDMEEQQRMADSLGL